MSAAESTAGAISLPTLGPINIPQHSVQTREYFVTVDSSDRDRTVWPTTSQYQVKMQPAHTFQGATIDRSFRNVESIEVVNAIFPNRNNVTDSMYLFLTIPEIDGVYEATSTTGNRALAKLVPERLIGNFVQCSFANEPRPRRIYPFEGARIDQLTIEFRTNNGALFSFGADTSPGSPPTPALQTSVTFRIVVRDRLIK